jgi:TonB family protein
MISAISIREGKQVKTRIILAALLLVPGSMGMAQSVSMKGDSLDKVQVLALVLGDVPSSRVATLVVERGIIFQPQKSYLDLLKKVGADDGVITAVRVAQRPPDKPDADAAPSRDAPLDRDQILNLLLTGMDSDVLTQLIASRGIDFEPYDEYLHAYEIAGAKPDLLGALRQAGESKVGASTMNMTSHEAMHPKTTDGAPAAKIVRMSGEMQSTRLISQVAPEYPQVARIARVQGSVRLAAMIGTDGTVEELEVITGHALLIKSAMDAVSKWRYEPMKLNGAPVEVQTEIDVNYVLVK